VFTKELNALKKLETSLYRMTDRRTDFTTANANLRYVAQPKNDTLLTVLVIMDLVSQ